MSCLVTFDLHYHPNVHGLRPHAASTRLARHREALAASGVDVVASTEHSYKRPRESYLRLAEACAGMPVRILPGVECISREGVDVIFLYPEEQRLEAARRAFSPYSWSVECAGRLARDTGGLLIVPHPFGLGTACAGNILSPEAYARLLSEADYVEVHNGAALAGSLLLRKTRGTGLFPQVTGRCSQSSCLPGHLRGHGLGWSIGSDTHYPGDQHVVGSVWRDAPVDDPYSLLRERVRFEPVWVRQLSWRAATHVRSVVMNGQCAAKEGVQKRMGSRRRRLEENPGRGGNLRSRLLDALALHGPF